MENIYFAKLKENAIIPSKDSENAGYDIYACFDDDEIKIKPHETVMVSTGIASACSEDYYFQLFERGSTGTKGMGQRCGVIDSGYRNEWFVPITNHNNNILLITKEKNKDRLNILKDFYIVYPYDKAICQAVLLPVPQTKVTEITYDELLKFKSNRMLGKLGDSGK